MAYHGSLIATRSFTITPADTDLAVQPIALWVGTAGTLELRLADDTGNVTITTPSNGYELRGYKIKQVRAASTAAGIIGFA